MQKTFSPNSGSRDEKFWQLMKELNDEAGVVSRNFHIYLYTNCNLNLKDPIKISEKLRYVPFPSETQKECIEILNKKISLINQALGLIELKESNEKDLKEINFYKKRVKEFLSNPNNQ